MEEIEITLYTAMNEYNKHGDKFNETIIQFIDNIVTKQIQALEETRMPEIDKLILKYVEVKCNCKLLLVDLKNIKKIDKLRKSIKELKIVEDQMIKGGISILEKLGFASFVKK